MNVAGVVIAKLHEMRIAKRSREVKTTVREQLARGCQECGLPRHMWEPLIEYVMIGRPPGDFLTALLTNDLLRAIKKADELNIQRLKDYCIWLESVAPTACFGSPALFDAWKLTGGLVGRQQALDRGLL